MFNAMSSEDVLLAVGRVLRSTADITGPLDDYQRGQLFSAYSMVRNLAAEQAGSRAALARAKQGLAAPLTAAPVDGIADLVPAFADVADGPALGAALCDVLERLRADDSKASRRLQATVQGTIRRLVDDEVAALAAGPPR